MITCNQCGTSKARTSYYFSNQKKCKDCVRANVRENRRKNADYYREYDRVRFQEDPRVRQRHAAYQATEAGKEAGNRAKRKHSENNPVKRAAHYKLANAIRAGKVAKPDSCEDCGSGGRICGHHDDYAKP